MRLQLPKPKLAQTLLPSHLAPATPSLAGDTTAMLVDARPQLWTASNTAPARAGHKDRYTVGRQRRHVRRVKAAPSHAAHMAALAGPSVSGLAEQPAPQPGITCKCMDERLRVFRNASHRCDLDPSNAALGRRRVLAVRGPKARSE